MSKGFEINMCAYACSCVIFFPLRIHALKIICHRKDGLKNLELDILTQTNAKGLNDCMGQLQLYDVISFVANFHFFAHEKKKLGKTYFFNQKKNVTYEFC
jgi:hypothetical protein